MTENRIYLANKQQKGILVWVQIFNDIEIPFVSPLERNRFLFWP